MVVLMIVLLYSKPVYRLVSDDIMWIVQPRYGMYDVCGGCGVTTLTSCVRSTLVIESYHVWCVCVLMCCMCLVVLSV